MQNFGTEKQFPSCCAMFFVFDAAKDKLVGPSLKKSNCCLQKIARKHQMYTEQAEWKSKAQGQAKSLVNFFVPSAPAGKDQVRVWNFQVCVRVGGFSEKNQIDSALSCWHNQSSGSPILVVSRPDGVFEQREFLCVHRMRRMATNRKGNWTEQLSQKLIQNTEQSRQRRLCQNFLRWRRQCRRLVQRHPNSTELELTFGPVSSSPSFSCCSASFIGWLINIFLSEIPWTNDLEWPNICTACTFRNRRSFICGYSSCMLSNKTCTSHAL